MTAPRKQHEQQAEALRLPRVPTGDYELDALIQGYQAGTLDAEGLALLREELADYEGGVMYGQ